MATQFMWYTEKLLKVLKMKEDESELAINRLSANDMVVKPEKLQIMIVPRRKYNKNKYTLKINDTDIIAKPSVTLLGVEIEKKLNLNNHKSTICQKASNKLNAISRMQEYLHQKEKQILVSTFAYIDFICAPLA